MAIIDIYKIGKGVIKKVPPVEISFELNQALKKYYEDNNLQVVAKEKCSDSYRNYLLDGTELDYIVE